MGRRVSRAERAARSSGQRPYRSGHEVVSASCSSRVLGTGPGHHRRELSTSCRLRWPRTGRSRSRPWNWRPAARGAAASRQHERAAQIRPSGRVPPPLERERAGGVLSANDGPSASPAKTAAARMKARNVVLRRKTFFLTAQQGSSGRARQPGVGSDGGGVCSVTVDVKIHGASSSFSFRWSYFRISRSCVPRQRSRSVWCIFHVRSPSGPDRDRTSRGVRSGLGVVGIRVRHAPTKVWRPALSWVFERRRCW